MNGSLSILNTTKKKPPRLPYEHIKNRVLGRTYGLSLVFIGDTRAHTLNRTYRKKDTIPDVLAFPLSKREGELFINPREAARRAPRFEMSEREYLLFIFIHGLLHLKGLGHGSTMECTERALLRAFGARR